MSKATYIWQLIDWKTRNDNNINTQVNSLHFEIKSWRYSWDDPIIILLFLAKWSLMQIRRIWYPEDLSASVIYLLFLSEIIFLNLCHIGHHFLIYVLISNTWMCEEYFSMLYWILKWSNFIWKEKLYCTAFHVKNQCEVGC